MARRLSQAKETDDMKIKGRNILKGGIVNTVMERGFKVRDGK